MAFLEGFRAWKGMRRPNADGFTPFQLLVLESALAFAAKHELDTDERRNPDGGYPGPPHLEVELRGPSVLTVWISDEFFGTRDLEWSVGHSYESYDFETPDAACSKLLEDLEEWRVQHST